MKRIGFFWALSFLINFSADAVNFEELFWQANNHYKQGSLKEALACYEAINPKGWGVWYNIGVCWYELQEPVQALVAWRRAERLGGKSDLALQQNLSKVRQQLKIEKPSSGLLGKFEQIVHSLPLRGWQLLFLGLWWLLVLFWFIRCSKMIVIFAFGLMLISAFFLMSSVWVHWQKSMIVCQEQTAHAGTSPHYAVIGTLRIGQEVVLLAQDGSWTKIRTEDFVGWVPTPCVLEI